MSPLSHASSCRAGLPRYLATDDCEDEPIFVSTENRRTCQTFSSLRRPALTTARVLEA